MITEKCNLRCTYCYQKKKNRTMTKQVAKKAIDLFLKNSKAKKKFIDIFGGEPLLCPELLEFIFSYALSIDKNVGFFIGTNGTVLTLRIKALLKKYSFAIESLSVSFDLIKGLHDSSRVFPDGAPTHDLILRNLTYLLKEFPELDIQARFHPKDASRGFLIKYAEEARKLGVKRMMLMPLIGKINSKNINLIAKEYALLYEWAYNLKNDGKDNDLHIRSIYPKLWKPDRVTPCGVATRTLFVASNGLIYPCIEHWVNGKKSAGTVFRPDYNKIFFFREYVFLGQDNKKYFRCPARMNNDCECLYTSDVARLDFLDRIFLTTYLLVRKAHPEIAEQDSKPHNQLPFCKS